MIKKLSFILAALWLSATPIMAESIAVIIGNRDYDNGSRIRGADAGFATIFPLRDAGFTVFSARDATIERTDRLMRLVLDRAPEAERIVIMAVGHILNARGETYVLPVDVDPRSSLTLRREALAVSELLEIAGSRPGGAIVVLGMDPRASITMGQGIEPGLSDLVIPQGVTLVSGVARDVIGFVNDVVLDDERSMADAAAAYDGVVDIQGYLSGFHPFLGPVATGVDREATWWEAVQAIGTEEAIDVFEDEFPDTRFAEEIAALRDDLRMAPLRDAEAAEADMNLTRNDRRSIQRALVLLGYDTRGIDGIFGNGTRGAIRQWQEKEGLFVSGYLDHEMVLALSADAQRRSDELEAEADAKAAEEARKERAFWRRTKRTDTAEAYREYLDRYPHGAYRSEARTELRRINRAQQEAALAEERDLWDDVLADDTLGSYEFYLEKYPEGAFADEARLKIEELTPPPPEPVLDIAALQQEEAKTVGNPILRLLAERRLAELGFGPGKVDGRFTDQTREAIKKYQESRGIDVTGYITQPTAVRMLQGK